MRIGKALPSWWTHPTLLMLLSSIVWEVFLFFFLFFLFLNLFFFFKAVLLNLLPLRDPSLRLSLPILLLWSHFLSISLFFIVPLPMKILLWFAFFLTFFGFIQLLLFPKIERIPPFSFSWRDRKEKGWSEVFFRSLYCFWKLIIFAILRRQFLSRHPFEVGEDSEFDQQVFQCLFMFNNSILKTNFFAESKGKVSFFVVGKDSIFLQPVALAFRMNVDSISSLSFVDQKPFG